MIEKQEQKYWFLRVAESMLHQPYRWAGDDAAAGFDCSGMVIECLKSVGMFPLNQDMTADGLWEKLSPKYETDLPRAGALAFWFDKFNKATHVAICVGKTMCITADGGGSFMKSALEAPPSLRGLLGITELADWVVRWIDLQMKTERNNAMVKMRRIDHRSSEPRFIYMFEG